MIKNNIKNLFIKLLWALIFYTFILSTLQNAFFNILFCFFTLINELLNMTKLMTNNKFFK